MIAQYTVQSEFFGISQLFTGFDAKLRDFETSDMTRDEAWFFNSLAFMYIPLMFPAAVAWTLLFLPFYVVAELGQINNLFALA